MILNGLVIAAILLLRTGHFEFTERAIQWPDALGLDCSPPVERSLPWPRIFQLMPSSDLPRISLRQIESTTRRYHREIG